jgi:hypothetical protein
MARFTGGWVKVYRSILEDDAFQQDLELCGLWIHILLMANYQSSKIDWGNQIRILEAGQVLLTYRELAEKYSIAKTNLLRKLKYLEKWDRIRIESGTHGTVITICNWKEYQIDSESTGPQADQEADHKRTKVGPQADLYKEVQEVKEEKNIRIKKNTKAAILTDYPPVFVSLWEEYGRHGNKKKALEAFKKLKLSEDDLSALSQAIKVYYERKEPWRSAQHFSTFLNSDWRQYFEDGPLISNEEVKIDWDKVKRELNITA